MIKMMQAGGEGKEEERGEICFLCLFSATRQMPCIIGGENEHNLIPFYEGGRDAREREKHNEAERGGGKREGEMPFLPPEKKAV